MIEKLIFKIAKIIIKSFPSYKMKILGIKLCGFKIGKQVYIGDELIIVSPLKRADVTLKIGNRVSIGPRATLVLTSHPNFSELSSNLSSRGNIILEDDCWIGAGVIILPGITIGEKAVVGAGSIVTKDVASGSIVVGNPAKALVRK